MKLEKLLRELKNFVKKEKISYEDFAVFGSGPLAVRKIRKPHDLDIIVKADVFKRLNKQYEKNKKDYPQAKHIEIAGDWEPYFHDSNMLIDTADIIDGIRYVKLKYVLEWKKQAKREKDKQDILLIEKYLARN